MHHPTDRITHTTAFVTPVVEHWLEREKVLQILARLHTKSKLQHIYKMYRNLISNNWTSHETSSLKTVLTHFPTLTFRGCIDTCTDILSIS